MEFEARWNRRIEVVVDPEGQITADLISVEDLIAAKVASGRTQDAADVEALRKAQRQKPRA